MGEERLNSDENWQKLEPEQKHDLRVPHGLVKGAVPNINVEDTSAVLATLDAITLPALKDRIAAMPGRYEQIILEAARLLEPQIKKAVLPSATLKTDADVDQWVANTSARLKEQIKDGPVIV
jgi:hypothetical protein